MLRCSRVRSVPWAMATPLLRKLFTSGFRVQRRANSRQWNHRATRAKSEYSIVLVDVAGDERRGADDRAGLAACRPPTLWAPGSLDSGADRARRVNTGAVVAWPVSAPSRFSCPTPPKSRLTTAPSTPMTGTSLPSTGTRSCAVPISSLPAYREVVGPAVGGLSRRGRDRRRRRPLPAPRCPAQCRHRWRRVRGMRLPRDPVRPGRDLHTGSGPPEGQDPATLARTYLPGRRALRARLDMPATQRRAGAADAAPG